MSYLASLLQKGDRLGARSSEAASPVAAPASAGPKITVNPALQTAPQPPPQPSATGLQAPSKKYRVMLCGTYPIGQSNGYSRVVYYIAKHLGKHDDIQLTIYGFQNYQQTFGAHQRNDIPASVILHDALATEQPRRNGFGEKEVVDYLRKMPQDMVIVFNDMVITNAIFNNIAANMTKEERKSFKVVSYMDQVYPYQKANYIEMLNANCDAVVTFTSYWLKIARGLGIKPEIPMYYFPHGFDPTLYYPIPRKLARTYYGYAEDAFMILNLNRNQPRKRWDQTIMAFADCVARHWKLRQDNPSRYYRPLQLVIGTQRDGYWNLDEVWQNEMRMLNIPLAESRKYLVFIEHPQQLSDRDINVLYNACDIGLNTCEGEGYGLCQFEHAAIGAPQICPNLGGFKEYLNENNSTMVPVKYNYYIDKQRDGIGGYAEVADTHDIADGIWRYYTNPQLLTKHGQAAREEILTHYPWEVLVDHFAKVIHHIAARPKRAL